MPQIAIRGNHSDRERGGGQAAMEEGGAAVGEGGNRRPRRAATTKAATGGGGDREAATGGGNRWERRRREVATGGGTGGGGDRETCGSGGRPRPNAMWRRWVTNPSPWTREEWRGLVNRNQPRSPSPRYLACTEYYLSWSLNIRHDDQIYRSGNTERYSN
jgi:hypothetical protein